MRAAAAPAPTARRPKRGPSLASCASRVAQRRGVGLSQQPPRSRAAAAAAGAGVGWCAPGAADACWRGVAGSKKSKKEKKEKREKKETKKEKKANKDPNEPKRAKSAYLLFCDEVRPCLCSRPRPRPRPRPCRLVPSCLRLCSLPRLHGARVMATRLALLALYVAVPHQDQGRAAGAVDDGPQQGARRAVEGTWGRREGGLRRACQEAGRPVQGGQGQVRRGAPQGLCPGYPRLPSLCACPSPLAPRSSPLVLALAGPHPFLPCCQPAQPARLPSHGLARLAVGRLARQTSEADG
jgi:hypothetical protein